MGTDIVGWVEVATQLNRRLGGWTAAVALEPLMDAGRAYDMLGCLFGVANYANFRPLAPRRGLPGDLSPLARQEYDRQVQGQERSLPATWIGWSEILAADWDEPAEQPDDRLHAYRRQADGHLVYDGKALWSLDAERVTGLSPQARARLPRYWSEGQEWAAEDLVFRAVRLRRREARTPAWERVFAIMGLLAEAFGAEQVRLVVWFDR